MITRNEMSREYWYRKLQEMRYSSMYMHMQPPDTLVRMQPFRGLNCDFSILACR